MSNFCIIKIIVDDVILGKKKIYITENYYYGLKKKTEYIIIKKR